MKSKTRKTGKHMKRYATIAKPPVTPGRVSAYERKCLPVDSPRTFRLFFDWPRVFYQKFPFKKIELSPSNSLRYASHSLEFSRYRKGTLQLALAVMIKAGYPISEAIKEHKQFADEVIFRCLINTEEDGRGAFELEVRKEGDLWRIEKLTRV